jgi:hypothetical protein
MLLLFCLFNFLLISKDNASLIHFLKISLKWTYKSFEMRTINSSENNHGFARGQPMVSKDLDIPYQDNQSQAVDRDRRFYMQVKNLNM